MDLVDTVYDASEGWPKDEIFGLRSQTRRAVVSVPANIAEGKERTGAREWAHHLSIAHGSPWETETLLHVARRRKYVKQEALEELLDLSKEVSWLIRGLLKTLH